MTAPWFVSCECHRRSLCGSLYQRQKAVLHKAERSFPVVPARPLYLVTDIAANHVLTVCKRGDGQPLFKDKLRRFDHILLPLETEQGAGVAGRKPSIGDKSYHFVGKLEKSQ